MNDSRHLFSPHLFGDGDWNGPLRTEPKATLQPRNPAVSVQSPVMTAPAQLDHSNIQIVRNNQNTHASDPQQGYDSRHGKHASPYVQSIPQHGENLASHNLQSTQGFLSNRVQRPVSFPSEQQSSQNQRNIILQRTLQELDNGDQKSASFCSRQHGNQDSYTHFSQPNYRLQSTGTAEIRHNDRHRPLSTISRRQSNDESPLEFREPDQVLKRPRWNSSIGSAPSILQGHTHLPGRPDPDLIIDQKAPDISTLDMLANVCAYKSIEEKYQLPVASYKPHEVNATGVGEAQEMAEGVANEEGEEGEEGPFDPRTVGGEEGVDDGVYSSTPQNDDRESSIELSDDFNPGKPIYSSHDISYT